MILYKHRKSHRKEDTLMDLIIHAITNKNTSSFKKELKKLLCEGKKRELVKIDVS